MINSDPIEKLIKLLSRLPGLGPRSERRATLYLLSKKETIMEPLFFAIKNVLEGVSVCKIVTIFVLRKMHNMLRS